MHLLKHAQLAGGYSWLSRGTARVCTCWGGVDGHVVCGVVQELGTRVALNVVGVVVTPPQLDIDPVLVAGLLVHHVIGVGHQAGLGHLPLVGCEQQDVCTGGVHLVRLPRMDGLLLHRLDLESVQLLVKDLAARANTYHQWGDGSACHSPRQGLARQALSY